MDQLFINIIKKDEQPYPSNKSAIVYELKRVPKLPSEWYTMSSKLFYCVLFDASDNVQACSHAITQVSTCLKKKKY